MDNVKKGLSNQAIGYLPLLLLIYVDHFTYSLNFVVSLSLMVGCLFLFHICTKDKEYQFSLLVSATTLGFCTLLQLLGVDKRVNGDPFLLAEVIQLSVLSLLFLFRTPVINRVKRSDMPVAKKTVIRNSLYGFYYISSFYCILILVHLTSVMLVLLVADLTKGTPWWLYGSVHIFAVAVILLVAFEQFRLFIVKSRLKTEAWLPVLNDKGRVMGSIALSVSRTSDRIYFHPVVRIAVTYKGMLYLVERKKGRYLFPEKVDLPFTRYVLFRQSIEVAVNESAAHLLRDKSLQARFLIRYNFENEKVKELVSLYVIRLKSEEQLRRLNGGKLWTVKQIEDNLKSGVFSGYFEKEFPYLQNTVLLADSFNNANDYLFAGESRELTNT